jgi:hypothetical protein
MVHKLAMHVWLEEFQRPIRLLSVWSRELAIRIHC